MGKEKTPEDKKVMPFSLIYFDSLNIESVEKITCKMNFENLELSIYLICDKNACSKKVTDDFIKATNCKNLLGLPKIKIFVASLCENPTVIESSQPNP